MRTQQRLGARSWSRRVLVLSVLGWAIPSCRNTLGIEDLPALESSASHGGGGSAGGGPVASGGSGGTPDLPPAIDRRWVQWKPLADNRNSSDFATAGSESETVVLDHETELMWERLPSLQSQVVWQEADAHCTDLKLGGYDDWRVPTRVELESIVDFSRFNPATATPFRVPEHPPPFFSLFYWTASKHNFGGADDMSRFAVDFDLGQTAWETTTLPLLVRCVRGGTSAEYPNRKRFLAQGDVVHDRATHLDWARTCSEIDESSKAEDYCDSLKLEGWSHWRLPTIRELQSIIDEDTWKVTSELVECVGIFIWSSTLKADHEGYHWDLLQTSAVVETTSVGGATTFRCVRDNP